LTGIPVCVCVCERERERLEFGVKRAESKHGQTDNVIWNPLTQQQNMGIQHTLELFLLKPNNKNKTKKHITTQL